LPLVVEAGSGLAIFGTNSEANSLTVKEKASLLDALLAAGLPAAKMMPGTGTCALPDTIELTRRAVEAGCGGVLMLPPFYYKSVSDEGLYRSFARVIDAVADDRLRIYLYHVPPVSQVPITLTLIERLLKAFPGIIAGVKDSSGDWNNTAAMLKDFQPHGFDVFAGTETILLKNMRGGGASHVLVPLGEHIGVTKNEPHNKEIAQSAYEKHIRYQLGEKFRDISTYYEGEFKLVIRW
jgi:4-hydroxy-tetrahydrodipicolinate synthase